MPKRLVYIDDDLLDRARASAGTTTIKATVEAGLRQLAAQSIAVQHIQRLRRAATLDPAKLAPTRTSRVRLK